MLLEPHNVDNQNRDVVGLGVRASITGPREYFFEQAFCKLVSREVLVLIDKIFQPNVAKFEALRVGRLDQSVRIYQNPVTGLQ